MMEMELERGEAYDGSIACGGSEQPHDEFIS